MASKDTNLRIIVDAQNRTTGALNAIRENLDGLATTADRVASSMRTVGTIGTVAFGGLAFLTKGVIAAGAGFEQTQIAFETMIGSVDKAHKTLADLAQFAARTPFELPQLEEASKRLLAYGVSADSLIPTLRMLGDISAGVGMDKLPQLILAFGQVKAITHLTGMELRQFSEAGVPLLGALATQFGKTEQEILDMVSAGEIGFADVQKALGSMTEEGGKFFNLMDRQSTSLGGMWSNLNDQMSLTARTIGEQLLPVLKPVVEKLIEIMGVVRQFVTENPQLSAGILIVALAFTGLMAVLLPIALALPGLVMLFTGLATAIAFVTALSAPMILAIGGIVTVLALLAKNGYLTKQAWVDVWTGIKVTTFQAVNAVTGAVESMINFVISGVNKAIEAINKVIKLAQKVPGIGDKLSTIKTIDNVNFGRINLDSAVSGQTPGLSSSLAAGTVINVTGNQLLDQDAAEKIGDLILQKLKLSNAL